MLNGMIYSPLGYATASTFKNTKKKVSFSNLRKSPEISVIEVTPFLHAIPNQFK